MGVVALTEAEPPPAREIGRWPLNHATDLPILRRRLHATVTESSADGDRMDDLLLVTTELGGNALRHGLPPVQVRLLSFEHRWLVEVSDGAPADLPKHRSAEGSACGRGLLITQAVAVSAGWCLRSAAKVVWAVMTAPEDATRSTP